MPTSFHFQSHPSIQNTIISPLNYHNGLLTGLFGSTPVSFHTVAKGLSFSKSLQWFPAALNISTKISDMARRAVQGFSLSVQPCLIIIFPLLLWATATLAFFH